MTPTAPQLALSNVEIAYGNVKAVRGVSLNTRSGQVTALIGANGAGKTTILKAVMGLLPVLSGEVTFSGSRISGQPVADIVARGLALVPEGRRLFPTMTVRENLLTGAYLNRNRSDKMKHLDGVLNHFPALREKLSQPLRTLSGGQQQMVAFGRALMSRPKVLLLDEPTIGLAPNLVKQVGEIIQSICSEGVDVLLIEQNASLALRLSTYAYVLKNGVLEREGPSGDLLENDAVRAAYLGVVVG